MCLPPKLSPELLRRPEEIKAIKAVKAIKAIEVNAKQITVNVQQQIKQPDGFSSQLFIMCEYRRNLKNVQAELLDIRKELAESRLREQALRGKVDYAMLLYKIVHDKNKILSNTKGAFKTSTEITSEVVKKHRITML